MELWLGGEGLIRLKRSYLHISNNRLIVYAGFQRVREGTATTAGTAGGTALPATWPSTLIFKLPYLRFAMISRLPFLKYSYPGCHTSDSLHTVPTVPRLPFFEYAGTVPEVPYVPSLPYRTVFTYFILIAIHRSSSWKNCNSLPFMCNSQSRTRTVPFICANVWHVSALFFFTIENLISLQNDPFYVGTYVSGTVPVLIGTIYSEETNRTNLPFIWQHTYTGPPSSLWRRYE